MEGPSLVILKEEIAHLVGQKLRECTSTLKGVDCSQFQGQKLTALRSWGKHFLFCFGPLTIKVHFLMFGSYRVNETREGKIPKLSLTFPKGVIHLYSCSCQTLTAPVDSLYDWRIDLMSDQWDAAWVHGLLKPKLAEQLGDVLLDQTLFAGAGNIIKNEVLYNLRLHPESPLVSLTPARRKKLVQEMRDYSFRFYEWKKQFVLKRNWQIYRKRVCPNCSGPVVMQPTGKLERISFFCLQCQPKT